MMNTAQNYMGILCHKDMDEGTEVMPYVVLLPVSGQFHSPCLQKNHHSSSGQV